MTNLFFTTTYCSENEQGETEENRIFEYYENYAQLIIKNILHLNDGDSEPMKNIMDLINSSVDEKNLSKMPVNWNPWF
jgi:hypothetical protein